MRREDGTVELEIWGDVICPWCWIGKRRVAAALALLGDGDRARVAVVWRSYELGADNRAPGPTAADMIEEIWGERAAARIATIRAQGAAEGVELNLHLARPVSTFDAHRLTHLAAARGVAEPLVERLLRGYHAEGLDVADAAVLARLAGEAGLDAREAAAVLASDAYAAEVRADERRAAELGVSGVPSVVVDGRAPVSGILPPDELRAHVERALALAAAEEETAPPR